MSLSKVQTTRLGVLLAVMLNEKVPFEVYKSLITDGFIYTIDEKLVLTDKGLDEKNRLCTLAGLNIKYAFERKKEKNKSEVK